MAPTIAAVFDFVDFFFVAVPLGFTLSTGTLRESPSQPWKMEELLCTNFKANGANIAPCAGLITIKPTSVVTLEINFQLTYLATPLRVDPSALP